MNPFDWRGPPFLLFFWAFVGAILLAAHLLRCRLERGDVPKLRAVDPYLIACLRGGETESIKLAVLSLLERALLTVDGHLIKAVDGARAKVTVTLERRVLQAASFPADARLLLDDPIVRQVTSPFAAQLAQQGLTPSIAQKAVRTGIGLGAFAIVSAVALRKLTLAYARGHHNVGFLIMSWLITLALVGIVLGRRQTRVGELLLADLRTMFDALRVRVGWTGSATPDETTLVSAVFGLRLSAMGKMGLFAADATGSGASGSCGGGCGGGGCGGGCGGCGS